MTDRRLNTPWNLRGWIRLASVLLLLWSAMTAISCDRRAIANSPGPASGAPFSLQLATFPPKALLPWHIGDALAEGWRVGEIERRASLVRFGVTHGGEETCVEVSPNTEPPNETCTRTYCIRSCPAADSPPALLSDVRRALENLESAPDHRTFVRRDHAPAAQPSPSSATAPATQPTASTRGSAPHNARLWLATNGLALILLAVVLGGWARSQLHVRRRAIPGAICVVLAVSLLLLLFKPEDIPTGWITMLREGRSFRNVQLLLGEGSYFAAGFSSVTDWLTGYHVVALRGVAYVNVGLAVVNAILCFFVASYVLGSWLVSLAFVVAYAHNINTMNAALSESPAILVTTYFWLGCIAAAVIEDHANATLRLRRLALLWLALLVGLAAVLRTELLALGAPALAVGVMKTFGWEATVVHTMRAVGRLLRAVAVGPLPLFLLAAAALVAFGRLPWPGRLSWLIAGLQPLNPWLLSMPQALGVFFPLWLIALFLLGVVHAAQRSFCSFLLPITVLILYKVYVAATHDTFLELFRYLMFLTPAVIFLAFFGYRELSAWARRWGWPLWWKRLALLLVLVSLDSPPAPLVKESLGRRHQLLGLTTNGPLLGRNKQTGARYLLNLVERYPRCTFLTKTVRAQAELEPHTGYRWVAFGAAAVHHQEANYAGESLEEIATQLVPGAACVLFYRSLDCDLSVFDGCRAETQGRVPIEERVLENLPYSDIGEYGAHRAEIRVGVYPVVPHLPVETADGAN